MGLHHLTRRLVQYEIDKIELHGAVQTRRKIMKEPSKVSMRRDCFRDLEKSLVLAMQEVRLMRRRCLVVHKVKHIHRYRAPSSVIQLSLR